MLEIRDKTVFNMSVIYGCNLVSILLENFARSRWPIMVINSAKSGGYERLSQKENVKKEGILSEWPIYDAISGLPGFGVKVFHSFRSVVMRSSPASPTYCYSAHSELQPRAQKTIVFCFPINFTVRFALMAAAMALHWSVHLTSGVDEKSATRKAFQEPDNQSIVQNHPA